MIEQQLEEYAQTVISTIINKYPQVQSDVLYLKSIYIDQNNLLKDQIKKIKKKHKKSLEKHRQAQNRLNGKQKLYQEVNRVLSPHNNITKQQRITKNNSCQYSSDLMSTILSQAKSFKSIFSTILNSNQVNQKSTISIQQINQLYSTYKQFYKSFKLKHKQYVQNYSYDQKQIHKNSTKMKQNLLQELKEQTIKRKQLQKQLQALQMTLQNSLYKKDKQIQKLKLAILNISQKKDRQDQIKKQYLNDQIQSNNKFLRQNMSYQVNFKHKKVNKDSINQYQQLSKQKQYHNLKIKNPNQHQSLQKNINSQRYHQQSQFDKQSSYNRSHSSQFIQLLSQLQKQQQQQSSYQKNNSIEYNSKLKSNYINKIQKKDQIQENKFRVLAQKQNRIRPQMNMLGRFYNKTDESSQLQEIQPQGQKHIRNNLKNSHYSSLLSSPVNYKKTQAGNFYHFKNQLKEQKVNQNNSSSERTDFNINNSIKDDKQKKTNQIVNQTNKQFSDNSPKKVIPQHRITFGFPSSQISMHIQQKGFKKQKQKGQIDELMKYKQQTNFLSIELQKLTQQLQKQKQQKQLLSKKLNQNTNSYRNLQKQVADLYKLMQNNQKINIKLQQHTKQKHEQINKQNMKSPSKYKLSLSQQKNINIKLKPDQRPLLKQKQLQRQQKIIKQNKIQLRYQQSQQQMDGLGIKGQKVISPSFNNQTTNQYINNHNSFITNKRQISPIKPIQQAARKRFQSVQSQKQSQKCLLQSEQSIQGNQYIPFNNGKLSNSKADISQEKSPQFRIVQNYQIQRAQQYKQDENPFLLNQNKRLQQENHLMLQHIDNLERQNSNKLKQLNNLQQKYKRKQNYFNDQKQKIDAQRIDYHRFLLIQGLVVEQYLLHKENASI